MTKIKQFITQILGLITGPAFSYLIHLGIVAVVAWAVSHGFHLSLPVFPTSLTTFAGLAFVKLALKNLGHEWHSGRLEAELEHQAKGDVSAFLNDFIQAAEGHVPAAKVA